MSSQVKNPPAFPSHRDPGPSGMTLRDYFAAKAMAAIIRGEYALEAAHGDPETWVELGAGDMATNAYQYADAMLKARQEGGAA